MFEDRNRVKRMVAEAAALTLPCVSAAPEPDMTAREPKQNRSRFSRWIEDPFGSIYAGLVAQVATLALLMAGLFGLSQVA